MILNQASNSPLATTTPTTLSKLSEKFDIVTNFGTAEHVFNIAAVFNSKHKIVRTGGVMLPVLPTFGDINHGFYNIHPTVYLDLAAANNYSIDDICYVDR